MSKIISPCYFIATQGKWGGGGINYIPKIPPPPPPPGPTSESSACDFSTRKSNCLLINYQDRTDNVPTIFGSTRIPHTCMAMAMPMVAMVPALLVHTTVSRYPNFRAERGLDTLAMPMVTKLSTEIGSY